MLCTCFYCIKLNNDKFTSIIDGTNYFNPLYLIVLIFIPPLKTIILITRLNDTEY